MQGFGADDRDLFESQAMPSSRDGREAGTPRPDRGSLQTAVRSSTAFNLLVGLGLLPSTRRPRSLLAGRPQRGPVDHRHADERQEGAELLAESSQWASAFAGLAQAWRRSPDRPGTAPSPRFAGRRDQRVPRLAGRRRRGRAADRAATDRPRRADPRGGRRPGHSGARPRRPDAHLYQHSARRSAMTHKYVAPVTGRGAEVRTLDEFFNRLIVVDRTLAVIPSQRGLDVGPGDPGALGGRLPRRHVRAHLGAGPALQQPRERDDAPRRRPSSAP